MSLYTTLVYKYAVASSFIMNCATIAYLQRHHKTTETRFDLIEKIQRDRMRGTEEYIDDAIEKKMEQLTSRK